jgi:Peptidase family M1 domain
MNRFPLVVLLVASTIAPAAAQKTTTSDVPLSDRRLSYRMNVSLDPDQRTVSGTERLTWRNPDSKPVAELQFHMYLNAFSNNESTFMKESGGVHRGFKAEENNPWGGIEILRMKIVGDDVSPAVPETSQTDLTDRIRFIQPDDDNVDDRTVIAVTLPEPLGGGETIVLDIDFESRLPEIIARTGWKEGDSGKPFFMVAQWFPKIGVYEIPGQRFVPEDAEHGQWNTHQFHQNTEFYADYGTYDVTIEVPADYKVGASGVRTLEDTGANTRTLNYRADDVHDFAWTASPDFLVYTDTWRNVSLRVLLQPAHKAQAKRHFDAAKTALEYYDDWVGEYPYTTLTLVDGLGGSNGMEYPTLITCGTTYRLPEWMRMLELVTIHEFGHQYFYGLIGSNEFEEAWLDEGMNSYIETRIMDDAYGPGAVIDFAGLQVSDIGGQRVAYAVSNPTRASMFTKAWEYEESSDYSTNSYMKPATVMHTLERYLGWETMKEFLHAYYRKWRFRHPTTRDLQQVAEEVSGQDLGWFFDQFIYGRKVVDYAVDSISNRRLRDNSEGSDEEEVADSSRTDTADLPGERTYSSKVWVERKASGIFPQTLRVLFDDGTIEERNWPGQEKWIEFKFEQPSRLIRAEVDPDNQILLDINRLNNRKILSSRADATLARKAQLRLATYVQQILILFSGLL